MKYDSAGRVFLVMLPLWLAAAAPQAQEAAVLPAEAVIPDNPATAQPASPAPGVEAVVPADANAPAAPPKVAPKPYQPSYGSVSYSVVFGDGTIGELRRALDQAERAKAEGREIPAAPVVSQPGSAVPVVAAAAPPPMLQFPAFHVSSIVYRSGQDWMLWINGQRVTPKRPFVGVEVAAVMQDRVTLRWKPDHWEYRALIWNAKVELSKPLSRMKSRDGSVHVDEKAQALSAVVKSNQTLVTGVPFVAEGKQVHLETSLQPPPLGGDAQSAQSAAQTMQANLAQAGQKTLLQTPVEIPPVSPQGQGANPNANTNPLPPSLNDVLNAASRPQGQAN